MSRIVTPSLVAALALSLAACAGPTPSAMEGPVAVYQPAAAQPDSSTDYTGTLEIIDGCLMLVEATDRVVPQFPADDVAWDEVAEALTYGGHMYRTGDTLTISLGGEAERGSPRPTQCEAGRYGLVVPLSE